MFFKDKEVRDEQHDPLGCVRYFIVYPGLFWSEASRLMPGSLPTFWAMSLNRPCHGKHSIAATWTTSWTTSWATSGTADFPTQTETGSV
jgi:hypothetical protein